MTNPPTGKYYLKSVHEEIDFIDRKLAHIEKYQQFDSDTARKSATKKLTDQRATLAATAQRLAAEGVEFKPNELPRSFRPKEPAVETVPLPPPAAEPMAAQANRDSRRHASAFAGTALDSEKNLQEYWLKKQRRSS